MSGLKKKGPTRRAPKRARQAHMMSDMPTLANSKRRNRRDSVKEFFFEYD